MSREILKIDLTEVSLVDKGANQEAKVSIFKRAKEEEMTEKVTDENNKEEMVTKASFDEITEELTSLKALVLAEGYAIVKDGIEKRAEPETMMIEGVAVEKSAIPAPVLVALEKAEKDRIEAALVKQAKEELPNFEEAVAKSILSKVGDDKEALAAIKKADEILKGAMTELGETDVDGNLTKSADALEVLIKAERTKSGSDYHTAYAAVAKSKEGKTLIAKSYKEDTE